MPTTKESVGLHDFTWYPLILLFFLCIFSNAIDTDVFVIMGIKIIDINIANSNKE